MKKAVRIQAVHAGDRADQPDGRWRIILDGILDNKEHLEPQNYFGFTEEVDDEDGESIHEWPFILRYNKNSSVFDWGSATDYLRENTDIYRKHIKLNEVFSRGRDKEAATYRIVSVESLT